MKKLIFKPNYHLLQVMKVFPIFLFSLTMFACVNNKSKIKALEKEVIAIHDEVMPKGININRVQRALKKIAKDTTLNESVLNDIRDQVKELSDADDAMTQWMAEYKAPAKDDTYEIAMDHLNQEKVKIITVKELMLTSLANGQKLLKELESKQ